MQRSLREILFESHIAAIAVAIFLLWFLDGIFQALLPLLYDAANFMFTAIAIFGIPYISWKLEISGPVMFAYLYSAGASLLAAYILSYWVYRSGPFEVLASYRGKLAWRKNVQEN
jgi:hypothetical protein